MHKQGNNPEVLWDLRVPYTGVKKIWLHGIPQGYGVFFYHSFNKSLHYQIYFYSFFGASFKVLGIINRAIKAFQNIKNYNVLSSNSTGHLQTIDANCHSWFYTLFWHSTPVNSEHMPCCIFQATLPVTQVYLLRSPGSFPRRLMLPTPQQSSMLCRTRPLESKALKEQTMLFSMGI